MLAIYLTLAAFAANASPAKAAPAANPEALKKSCEAGRGLDCSQLATMYHDGKGVAKDARQALAFMRKACEKAVPKACATVSAYEAEAKYAWKPADKKAALAALEKPVPGDELVKDLRDSCDATGDAEGSAEACATLANMYEDGLTVKEDAKQARVYYKKACDKGDQEACENLKRLGK